jgi:hypothetical protein
MSDTIWLALIVAVPAMLSPLLMALLTNRHAAAKEARDHARQDVVAAQVADTARLLKANTKAVAETAAETHSQLKVIHTLVNSNMSAAMQAEHDATARELAMMREVIDLKRKNGHEPSDEAMTAIKATEAKIAELKLALADRQTQAKAAAAIT